MTAMLVHRPSQAPAASQYATAVIAVQSSFGTQPAQADPRKELCAQPRPWRQERGLQSKVLARGVAPGIQPRLLHIAEKQVTVFDPLLSQAQQFLAEHERVLVVAASTLIMSLSHTALRPVLPIFAKGFGVGAAAVGITLSVYAGARLMMNLPAGILADKRGRKPLLVWGPAVTALGMLGCGQAATFRQLLFWRWVTGIGSALQMTGAQLFLADISTRSNRARSLGINQSAALLGSLAGPAIGGLMADAAGLQAPFIFTGVAAGVAAVYGAIRLPETRPPSHQPLQAIVPSDETPAAGADARPTGHAQSIASSDAGPIPVPVPTHLPARSAPGQPATHHTAPKRRKAWPAWRKLLGSRDFRAVALLNAVMFATTNGGRAVLMPLMAVEHFSMTPSILGLLFAVMSTVSLMGIMPAATVSDHLGRKWTIVPACLALAAALVIMASTGQMAVFAGAAMLFAAANSCIGATPAAYAADVMPSSVSGLGLGIYRCAGDLGLMLGPALLGWIGDATSVQVALQANAVLLLGAVAFFAWQARETRHLRSRSPR